MADEFTRNRGAVIQVSVLANLMMKPYYRRTQKPYGLSLPEWRSLRTIAAQPGISQTEIAETSGIHLMTLSRSVQGLLMKGWIRGELDEADRRRTQLFCTDRGLELANEIGAREEIHSDYVMDVLEPDEVDQLERLVSKLVDHLSSAPLPEPPPPSRDWTA